MAIFGAPKRDIDPAPNAAPVTPSNTALLTGTQGNDLQTQNVLPRWLRIGGAGNLYVDLVGNGAAGASATGTLTISGGSGTVGGVINGVTVTVTWATGDNETATALAAAITAAAATTFTTATASTNVVTLTSTVAGSMGNALSLAASGTGVTASGSGFLSGGTGGSGNYVKYICVAGQKLDIRPTKVYALGTTATNIVAEW